MRTNLPLLILCVFFSFAANGQNLAQRLGYQEDSRLLIIHADDMGVAHSVNKATIQAYTQQAINSGSIMVPCPWFAEIAKYFRVNPRYDYGLHITLNNEWKFYNWDGVSAKSDIPSLLNEQGYLYDNVADFLKNAAIDEVELEIRAQIERALAFGLQPTHLDSHMGALYQDPRHIEMFLKVGREYNIPVMYISELIPPGVSPPQPDLGLTSIYGIDAATPPQQWREVYDNHIKNLEPGVHEIIVHLAQDDDEMQAMTVGFEGWHAAWRQRDLDYVMSPHFQQLIRDQGIILVTWGEIKELLK